LVQLGRKAVSKFELPETQFEKQTGTKLPVKPTWSGKMTVLSTFLESSLSFLSNNIKNTQLSTVSEESQSSSLKINFLLLHSLHILIF